MSGSTLSRVLALIDLNASCSKISRRFGLILDAKGEDEAWDYLERMVNDHRLTKKGLDGARELYKRIGDGTVHEGEGN